MRNFSHHKESNLPRHPNHLRSWIQHPQ
jgi:hypothetical protein